MKRFFVRLNLMLCTLMLGGATGILNTAHGAAALQAVAYLGQNDRVTELLKNDLSPQALAEGLCSAIEGGHTATARLIMAKNPDYTVCSSSFLHSAVGSAVKEGNTEILNLLIAAGAPVSIPGTQFKETPLHLAAAAGRADHVRMLLSAGADVNAVGGFNKTPLASVSIINKQTYNQIVRMLLAAGADPNIEHPVLRQPFLMAAILQNDVALVRILLTSDKISQDTKDGMLRYVATEPGFSPEIAAALLAAGANPHSKSQEDRTAIHYAFHHDNAAVVQILFDIVVVDRNNVFVQSILRNKPACCRMLLNRNHPDMNANGKNNLLHSGIDANCTNRTTGNTLLHAAFEKGFVEVAKILVAAGANPDAQNNAGQTPRDLAAGKPELLVALATPQRPDSAELHAAIEAKDSAAVQKLIDAGVDVTAKDAKGFSPLMNAVKAQNSEIVRMLLKTKLCDIHELSPNGNPPLISSLASKNEEITKLLLEYGANPNQETERGVRSLSLTDDNNMLDLLIEHGVNLNELDLGYTKLHLDSGVSSIDDKIQERIKKLLAAGANPNVTNSSGDTPLHQLVRSDCCPQEIIAALVNAGADVQKKNKADESPIDLATKHNPALLAVLAPHLAPQPSAHSNASSTPSQPTTASTSTQSTPATGSTNTQTGTTPSTSTSQVQGSSSSSSTEPQPTPTPLQSDPKNTPHKGRDIIDLDIPFNDSHVPRHSKNTAEIKNLVDKMNDNQPTDLTPLVMPTVLIAGTVSGYKGYQAFKKEKTEIIARNKILPAEQRIPEAKITQAALRATVKKHPWLAGIFAASLLGGAVDIAYRLS